MRDFFESFRFKVVLIITAMLIGGMVYAALNGGVSSAASYVIDIVFEPLKKLSNDISSSVSESLDMYMGSERYYNENQQLREELNSLYSKMMDYDRLKEENEQLRKMLELKETYETYEFSPPCTVIARTTNDPYYSFTVDKGSNDGIEIGDPVVTADGIVGVIDSVGYTTSKVRTLFAPESSMGAYTVRTKQSGLVSGGFESGSDGFIRMDYLNNDSDVRDGDIVVTSGSEEFPAGQIIGIVADTKVKDNGLSKYANVRPVVDPREVGSVFVIINYEPDEATIIKNGLEGEE